MRSQQASPTSAISHSMLSNSARLRDCLRGCAATQRALLCPLRRSISAWSSSSMNQRDPVADSDSSAFPHLFPLAPAPSSPWLRWCTGQIAHRRAELARGQLSTSTNTSSSRNRRAVDACSDHVLASEPRARTIGLDAAGSGSPRTPRRAHGCPDAATAASAMAALDRASAGSARRRRALLQPGSRSRVRTHARHEITTRCIDRKIRVVLATRARRRTRPEVAARYRDAGSDSCVPIMTSILPLARSSLGSAPADRARP